MIVLCLAITISMSSSAFATDIPGEGFGVGSYPPSLGITIFGVDPPPESNGTVKLGTYEGDIEWATGYLFSNKWVKTGSTSDTTIDIEANFGTYLTKEDAMNDTNWLVTNIPNIAIYLKDSSGKKTTTKYVKADRLTHSVSFTVTGNKPYYIVLAFNTGYYHSGWFTVD